MQKAAGIVLAAGKGTRMRSAIPKVLRSVGGIPMVQHVVRAMRSAGVDMPVVVYGYGGSEVQEALGEGCHYVHQGEQRGTGHACLVALPALGDYEGPVLIAPGDAPLVTEEVFRRLLEEFANSGGSCVLATVRLSDPRGYGRLVRDGEGRPLRVVEQADISSEEIAKINEVVTSFYCCQARALRDLLPKLSPDNAKAELYLTDIVALATEHGFMCSTVTFEDEDLLRGVNDLWQLAEANRLVRIRKLKSLAEQGVCIIDPDSTFIDVDVTVGEGSTIRQATVIEGVTRIGANCEVGPMTRIVDSEIGDECLIHMSHVNRVVMGRGCRVGPFANLRPHTKMGVGVKVGDFVEVKASEIGDEASISHLAYVGDSTVGERANIGAGTVTCNYDGFSKHPTEIGKDAFIGSNSTLVAPVKIGDGAIVGAGSTITEDVPDNALGIGRSRQENKEDWAERWRRKKRQ